MRGNWSCLCRRGPCSARLVCGGSFLPTLARSESYPQNITSLGTARTQPIAMSLIICSCGHKDKHGLKTPRPKAAGFAVKPYVRTIATNPGQWKLSGGNSLLGWTWFQSLTLSFIGWVTLGKPLHFSNDYPPPCLKGF